jgi:hypothetical protein
MDIFEELKKLIEALRREDIPYALCGGLALAVYGITRATEDIDLLVPEPALPRVRALAEELGFRFDPEPAVFKDGGVTIYRLFKTAGEEVLLLDLLLVTPLTQPAWDTQREVDTEFGPARVVSPAGLIHLKSLRRSGQDQDDISRLKRLDDEIKP